MIRSVGLALAILVTLSAPLQSQNRKGQNDHDPGPIGTLLLRRAELGLTDEQVTRLSEIEAKVDLQNQPHVEQFIAVRRRVLQLGPRDQMNPEQREQYHAYMGEMRTLLKQIESNSHAAMKEVGSVLTEQQRGQLWRFLQHRNVNRDRSGDSERLPDSRD